MRRDEYDREFESVRSKSTTRVRDHGSTPQRRMYYKLYVYMHQSLVPTFVIPKVLSRLLTIIHPNQPTCFLQCQPRGPPSSCLTYNCHKLRLRDNIPALRNHPDFRSRPLDRHCHFPPALHPPCPWPFPLPPAPLAQVSLSPTFASTPTRNSLVNVRPLFPPDLDAQLE